MSTCWPTTFDIWMECSCSWVPIEVRFSCKTSVKQSAEHCLIAFDDIPSCQRIRGGISWLDIERNSSFPLNSLYGPWLMWFLQTNLILILSCCKNVLSIHWKSDKEDFLEFQCVLFRIYQKLDRLILENWCYKYFTS